MLACCSEEQQEAALLYGKHIGLAFQLVDDLLDFESTQDALGKPTLNDLKQVHVLMMPCGCVCC